MDIKPGSRVRVTYEGEWCGETANGVAGFVRAAGAYYWVQYDATVEVLPPPEPSWANVEGAVVLDNYGRAWQLGPLRLWHIASYAHTQVKFADLERAYGRLTLLHDPSVES
jgi:hypothetical protein